MTYKMTMIRVNVADAKAHLSEYLDKLEGGQIDAVVLCRRNEPIAEIRPLPRAEVKPRPVGRAKGTFSVPATFFDPLPEELVAAFAGET
jgi:antitoxin (DNA-binding transcriptional repressor) of toxin-antitoxin stability system